MITIMLDIDGVLRKDSQPALDMHFGCVARFGVLCKSIGEHQVVLSSAWRIVFGPEATLATMQSHGYSGQPFVGVTKDLGSRQDDIQAYIDEHNLQLKDVLILEDLPLAFPLSGRQIKTNVESGLTPKKLLQAIRLARNAP